MSLEQIDAKMKRGYPGRVSPEEIAAMVEYVKAAEHWIGYHRVCSCVECVRINAARKALGLEK